MKLMSGCRDVSRFLAEDDGSGTGLTFRVRLHLLMCRHCRRYRKQLALIAETARSLWSEGDDTVASELKQKILGEHPSNPTRPGTS